MRCSIRRYRWRSSPLGSAADLRTSDQQMTDVEQAIREGLVAKLGLPQDDAQVTVRDPEDGPPVSEEYRMENALYVTATAGGFGHTVWIPKQMVSDRDALVAVGEQLAYEIAEHRSARDVGSADE